MNNVMPNADYWIDQLQLKPHPEGGYYKETYRSHEVIAGHALPDRFPSERSFATAIYFLLRHGDISHFHRIKSDELWHYHAGGSLTIHVLNDDGTTSAHRLGTAIEKGESLQVVIPANCWFGAKVNDTDDYVLAGCTVAPGFDFHDFELAKKEDLLKTFPAHQRIIEELTK